MARKSASGHRTTGTRRVASRLRTAGPGDVRGASGIAAAAAVCLLAAVRVARNAPLGRAPVGVQPVHDLASPAAVLVPAAAAVAVGVVADDDRALVGLIAAGVFAVFAGFGPGGAAAAAAGVLPGATALVAAPALLDRPRRRAPVAALAVAAVALSLGATAGPFGPGVRWLGTAAAFGALAVAPLAVRPSPLALGAGVGAAAFVAAGALAAPFVAGAAFLAVGAAVDPGIALAALGVGGGVAVVAESARRRRVTGVAAGLLLLGAGIPATVPRALAVVLGLHLLVVAGERLEDHAVSGGEAR
ncbi:hypothetical protein [Halomicrobium urmianum]|uniref:hypothetical protein n=1 Tax=Halomicrobium urmianum TaxID=1586233 RepID=UPI001CD9D5F5|nr:hypothetical protein [Halomicrobium urmianum]